MDGNLLPMTQFFSTEWLILVIVNFLFNVTISLLSPIKLSPPECQLILFPILRPEQTFKVRESVKLLSALTVLNFPRQALCLDYRGHEMIFCGKLAERCNWPIGMTSEKIASTRTLGCENEMSELKRKARSLPSSISNSTEPFAHNFSLEPHTQSSGRRPRNTEQKTNVRR
jgi:hypothetical protein